MNCCFILTIIINYGISHQLIDNVEFSQFLYVKQILEHHVSCDITDSVSHYQLL